MNLLRKTWGIVIAVIISSCHSATFDITREIVFFFVPNWDWKQMRKSLPVT